MRIDFGEYRIRDWAREDADDLARYANNRRIAMWMRDRFPFPYTELDAAAFLEIVAAQEVRTVFAIARADGAIGGIGLEFGADVHRFTAELGYWLGEPFWGQGIMTEAVRLFTAWAFESFDVHRLYAGVFAGHGASVRVLERAGFQREGCLRANVFKDGRIMDQFLYARIKDRIVTDG